MAVLGRFLGWVGGHLLETAGILAVAVVVGYVSVQVDRHFRAEPAASAPDTVTVERQITKRDTVTETVPRTVVRYDTVRIVDTIKVAAPPKFDLMGLVGPSPIDISRREVTLTYFDPKGKRYTQNVYDVPPERYRAGFYAVGLRQWKPQVYQAGLGVEVYLDPEWLPGAIEPFAEVRVGQRLTATTGPRWHIVQLFGSNHHLSRHLRK
jgi:hypothetical protein